MDIHLKSYVDAVYPLKILLKYVLAFYDPRATYLDVTNHASTCMVSLFFVMTAWFVSSSSSSGGWAVIIWPSASSACR